MHLGSNLGDRFNHLNLACKLLEQAGVMILERSKIYETEAWGLEDQAKFLNQALKISTDLSALELLDCINKIEDDLQRKRLKKWGARTIDIDILFYNNDIIDTKRLTIPHPLIEKRNFVLIPMLNIGPDLIHPISKKNIKTLVLESNDKLKMTIWNP